MAMSNQQLVDLFEKLSIAEGEAYAYFETAKANRYFRRRRAVVSELRHRGTDERAPHSMCSTAIVIRGFE